MIRISKKEMLDKYGIDLSAGRYRFADKGDSYEISKVEDHTLGCVLVGNNSVVGRLTDSFNTFCKLYAKLDSAHKKGEEITLTIEKR